MSGWSFSDGAMSPIPPRPEWFSPVVDLIVYGEGDEDRVDGVVLARIDDEGGIEFRYRVQRRGRLYRCSSLDGSVHAIRGRDTTWVRHEGQPSVITTPAAREVGPPDDYEFGTSRPRPDRFDGEDFTVPTGPPRRVPFLGRDALEIELAPPRHKPFPMQLTIDAGTGLELRVANTAFGTFHEWISLDTDAELADELFAWQPDDRVAERYG